MVQMTQQCDYASLLAVLRYRFLEWYGLAGQLYDDVAGHSGEGSAAAAPA